MITTEQMAGIYWNRSRHTCVREVEILLKTFHHSHSSLYWYEVLCFLQKKFAH